MLRRRRKREADEGIEACAFGDDESVVEPTSRHGDWAGLQGEPAAQMGIERGLVAGGNAADDLAHEAGFDGGELRFDGAGGIQAGGLPVGQREVGMAEPGGEGDDEQVAGESAEADDDGGADPSGCSGP